MLLAGGSGARQSSSELSVLGWVSGLFVFHCGFYSSRLSVRHSEPFWSLSAKEEILLLRAVPAERALQL